MAMGITGTYGSAYGNAYAAQHRQAAKKEEPAATSAAQKSPDTGSGDGDYAAKLAKLVPSVEFRVGSTYASGKTGKTLTVDPRLIEKMQNDPEKEKEMMELIRGVESMTRLSESINKATGWKTVFRHSYIDADGKYRHFALIRNEAGYKMSEKLREERKKLSEELFERAKEKAAEKKEALREALEKKKDETQGEESKTGKAEKLVKDKIANAKDGIIRFDDADFRELLKAMKEDQAEAAKEDADERPTVGVNLDIRA